MKNRERGTGLKNFAANEMPEAREKCCRSKSPACDLEFCTTSGALRRGFRNFFRRSGEIFSMTGTLTLLLVPNPFERHTRRRATGG
jgi:hypothetical protein